MFSSQGVGVFITLLMILTVGCVNDSAQKAGPYLYYGIAQVAGVDIGALPLAHLTADADGRMHATARTTVQGVDLDTSPWFGYCPSVRELASEAGMIQYFVEQGSAPWYANLSGKPVHARDIPVGQSARATWQIPGTVPPFVTTLRLAHLPDAELSPLARSFALDGVIAFRDSAPLMCTQVKPIEEGGEVGKDIARTVPTYNGTLFVDTVHGGAWNPRWVIRDLFALERPAT